MTATALLIDELEKKIPNGNLILINGTQETGVESIFNWWTKKILERASAVVIVCFHTNPKIYGKVNTVGKGCKCIILDGYTDPLGWNTESERDGAYQSKEHSLVQITVHDNILKHVENAVGSLAGADEPSNVVVIFDSLLMLVRHQGTRSVCSTLNRLRHLKFSGVVLKSILAVVNTDVLQRDTIENLRYYASTIIQLESQSKKESPLPCHGVYTEVITKKKTGKIQREKTVLYFTQDGELKKKDATEIKGTTAIVDEKQADPLAQSTFRLQLNDTEREARAQLNLPYTYNQQRKTEHLNRSVGEGKVFYQPDEVDDFDDEDPDDDLDI